MVVVFGVDISGEDNKIGVFWWVWWCRSAVVAAVAPLLFFIFFILLKSYSRRDFFGYSLNFNSPP